MFQCLTSYKNLLKLQHPPPSKPQHAPHKWIPPIYGSKTQQQAIPPDITTPLSPSDTKFIESVVCSVLYYVETIDKTILTALNEIGTKYVHPTMHPKKT